MVLVIISKGKAEARNDFYEEAELEVVFAFISKKMVSIRNNSDLGRCQGRCQVGVTQTPTSPNPLSTKAFPKI